MAKGGPLNPRTVALAVEEARRWREEEDLANYAAERARREPWLTIAEAAYELGVSESRISQLISKGILTADKAPRRVNRRVLAAQVYAYRPRPMSNK